MSVLICILLEVTEVRIFVEHLKKLNIPEDKSKYKHFKCMDESDSSGWVILSPEEKLKFPQEKVFFFFVLSGIQ